MNERRSQRLLQRCSGSSTQGGAGGAAVGMSFLRKLSVLSKLRTSCLPGLMAASGFSRHDASCLMCQICDYHAHIMPHSCYIYQHFTRHGQVLHEIVPRWNFSALPFSFLGFYLCLLNVLFFASIAYYPTIVGSQVCKFVPLVCLMKNLKINPKIYHKM